MMFRPRTMLGCGLIALGLGMLMPGEAVAQSGNDIVQEYNAAQQSNDRQRRIMAAIKLGELAIGETQRDDSVVLAYEAGQSLCRLNNCDGAMPFTQWLSEQGAATEDIDPGDLSLLIAFANWSDSPKRKERQALDNALGAYVERDPSFLSVVAFQRRYAADLAAQKNWKRVESSSAEAAQHFAAVKDIIGLQWSDARTSQLVAAFNNTQEEAILLDMARHWRELIVLATKTFEKTGAYPDWIVDHRYRAEAWSMAMEAYFQTNSSRATARRVSEEADAIIGEYVLPTLDVSTDSEPSPPDSLPLCDGTFDMKPALRYPSGAARKGLFGAAIMRITVRDNKVFEVEALAAVPFEGFKESAADTIRKWSWVPDDAGLGTSCGPDRDNIILPLIFSLS